MKESFTEYKELDLPSINAEINGYWREHDTFALSVTTREGGRSFIFFEGPPSANGKPGIHHVMARTIKDVVCRYKTLSGFKVERKAGWDTHGLPVELSVEKALGITKDDIGKKISVADYNNICRKEVMKYTGLWEQLTTQMGYWVDMNNPYITYDNRYIETVWYLLKRLYDKGLLYKGYTIQPYSPAAGTGLSTHELNQPGCYRDVKDTTVVSLFKVIRNSRSEQLFASSNNVCFMAWTTTPWTLPSNTALAVGPNIAYLEVDTYNPYSGKPITVILCKERLAAYFKPENKVDNLNGYTLGDKQLPFKIVAEFRGSDLTGIAYEQLIDWMQPLSPAFRVIEGDYVTTDDGTGIVHIAPTFGADDARVAKAAGIPALILYDKDGNLCPMVDKHGRFFAVDDIDADFVAKHVNMAGYATFAGRYVKKEYETDPARQDLSVDVDIAVMLKQQDKAFRIEKHVHNYPHCWRTDKPVLYYPLDSWFVKASAVKDRLIELNKTINWKPASTGEGRFGKWLENLMDWNLSRSRYWGTPLPIWRSDDGKEQICIGSVAELMSEIKKAQAAGFMSDDFGKGFVVGDNSKENYDKINLHRPDVDKIVLVSPTGRKMFREPDLIDVWFDSGSMPYAQWHYPFEHKDDFHNLYPADFIAEGVDQTRGWFYTLHAISTMISDSPAFKNIISNGLVLDKAGNKMSKRLGNAVDPFTVMNEHGADALRWYMITNSQAWDNLKFDVAGVDEVKRKFFGTLYNTYNFFALYANIDKFRYSEPDIDINRRPELDKWILSLLNTLVKQVGESYENYENTKAGRLIQDFVIDNLSNWYVRLGRKRYWGGNYDDDKISAYQTLYTCLITVAKLASPIAPFFMEKLYLDLNTVTGKETYASVHLSYFPQVDNSLIDNDLEERMAMAQTISSMILGLRRKVGIKVRQPLQRIIMPVVDSRFVGQIEQVKHIILTETNIKDISLLEDTSGVIVKRIKANFKVLGPKFGKQMKQVAAAIASMSQQAIATLERNGSTVLPLADGSVNITTDDVDIISEDIPGWLVANEGRLTVALDINITPELHDEGIAREVVNKIQNLRKDSGFEVTDRIFINIETNVNTDEAINHFADYICTQTLAKKVTIVEQKSLQNPAQIDIGGMLLNVKVEKIMSNKKV